MPSPCPSRHLRYLPPIPLPFIVPFMLLPFQGGGRVGDGVVRNKHLQ